MELTKQFNSNCNNNLKRRQEILKKRKKIKIGVTPKNKINRRKKKLNK